MSRSVKSTFNTDKENIILEVTTSHDKDRKHYRTSVWRAHHDGAFISVSIMEDSKRDLSVAIPTARFSQKKLEEAHAQFMAEQFEPRKAELLQWAAAKVIR